MDDRSLTKAQLREVRHLASLAHERELAKAVGELQSDFERWRGGEIDVFELNERIHKFHNGASRELYKRYVMGEYHELHVAAAILDGIIQESEVSPAVLENIRSTIEWIKRARGRNDETV